MRPPHSSFGNDITNRQSNGNNNGDNDPNRDNVPPHIARIGGIVTFSRVAGRGVIRVVGRCEDAKENNKLVIRFQLKFDQVMAHIVVKVVTQCEEAEETLHLDLSECELMQVPDAVYHLMRNTELKTCNLSHNVIQKISPKFALKFSLITDLDLSHNKMAKLPDELANLMSLQRLDISYNSFIVMPTVVFKMPKLKALNASHNAIIEIDTDQMICSDSLETVDLRENPLASSCYKKIKNADVCFRLELSELNDDDW